MGCILWEHKKEQFIIKDLDDITLDIPFTVDICTICVRGYEVSCPSVCSIDLMHALGLETIKTLF